MGILEGNSSNILRVEQNLWYIEDWRYPAIEKVTLSGSLQTQHKECIRVMNLFLIPNRDNYYEALRHFLLCIWDLKNMKWILTQTYFFVELLKVGVIVDVEKWCNAL